MPSPRLSALEVLTAAGLVPQQLQLEQQRAARDANSTQAITGAISGLVPQLANVGTQLSDKADADAMQKAQLAAAADVGSGGAQDPTKTTIGIDPVKGAQANIGYTDDARTLAQKRADAAGLKAPTEATDFPSWLSGTLLGGNDRAERARSQFIASDVGNIQKARATDRQNALDDMLKGQESQAKGLDIAAKKVNVGQDVLKNVATPNATFDLGPSDLARLDANPNAPDMQAPILSRQDQFAKDSRSAAEKLGLPPDMVSALSGGELQARDSAAERQAAAEKEAARQRDIQNAAQLETARHNKASESLGYASLNQSAKAAASLQSSEDADIRAKAIAENREPPPSLRDRDYSAIMGRVRRINPAYDPSQWSAYSHTRSEQATDKGIQAGRAVVHHMDELRAIVDKMPSGSMTDTPLLNRGKQWLAGGLGSDDYTALQTAAHVVGDELSTALGVGDMSGRAQVMHLVRPEQTKEQWLASLGELEKLRNEKLGVAAKTLGDLGPQAPPQVSGKQALVDALLSQNATPEQIQAELTRRGF